VTPANKRATVPALQVESCDWCTQTCARRSPTRFPSPCRRPVRKDYSTLVSSGSYYNIFYEFLIRSCYTHFYIFIFFAYYFIFNGFTTPNKNMFFSITIIIYNIYIIIHSIYIIFFMNTAFVCYYILFFLLLSLLFY
jgi:hypothetical protein